MCSGFDIYFDKWHEQIGALCFVLTRSRRGADYAAFQAFLRLGGAKNAEIGEPEARLLLFGSAVRLCDDFYLKKLRRKPRRSDLQAMDLPFPVTDSLTALLSLGFARRAALALAHFGFSREEIAGLLRRSPRAAGNLLAAPGIPGWEEALDALRMGEDEAAALSDRIYERFAVRTVSVENAIHDARNAFDRLAPLLALGVLALFAFAVWYVSR